MTDRVRFTVLRSTCAQRAACLVVPDDSRSRIEHDARGRSTGSGGPCLSQRVIGVMPYPSSFMKHRFRAREPKAVRCNVVHTFRSFGKYSNQKTRFPDPDFHFFLFFFEKPETGKTWFWKPVFDTYLIPWTGI